MRLLAHRCAPAAFPENSLEAMAAAADSGADAIECDVQLAADGEVVLFHDRDLRRLTGFEGRVGRLPYAEVSRHPVRGRWRIPRLEEALDFLSARPGLELFLDLHSPSLDLAEAVARAVERKGLWERCFLLGFYSESRHFLLGARSLCPRLRVALMPEYPWTLLEKARRVGCEELAIGWDQRLPLKYLFFGLCRLFDLASEVRRARAAGVRVSGGVANTPEEVRWCVEAGVDGIWTDDLAMARRALRGLEAGA